MKTYASRILAAAALLSFIGLYGCNEDSGTNSDSLSGTLSASAPVDTSDIPSAAASRRPEAIKSLDAAKDTRETLQGPAQSDDSLKAKAGKSFDGNGDSSALSNDQAGAVPVTASSRKPVAYTKATAPVELDNAAHAPPAPKANPEMAACETVLKAHGQPPSMCGSSPRTAMIWAGFKDALAKQFLSWKGIASTVVLTLVGYILSGGLAAVAKVLKVLLYGASLWMVWGLVKSLYSGAKRMIAAKADSKDYDEGLWQVSRSITTIAVIAGLVKVGSSAADAASDAAAAAKPQFEKPGIADRVGQSLGQAWQAVRGWRPWASRPAI